MRLTSFLVSAVLVVGSPASAQQPDGVPHPLQGAEPPGVAFQVVRSGDNAMSCEALIDELAGLHNRIQQLEVGLTQGSATLSRNAAADMRGGSMNGAAMSLGGLAAAFIPGASMVMGAVSAASVAAQRAQMEQHLHQQTAVAEALTASLMDLGPMSERAAHLAEISRNKAC